MDNRYDIYYKGNLSRLVEHNLTPSFIRNQWKLGFSFYAFPRGFLPVPKNCTRIVTYFRSIYPYDTYAIYPDYNPIDEYYEVDTEPMNLTVTFTAYSDGVLNTIPLYFYESSIGGHKSIFFSPVNKAPSGDYIESILSPIYVALRPIYTFKCVNTICKPSIPSNFQMLEYKNWEKIKQYPDLLLKVSKEIDDPKDILSDRILYDNIYDCLIQCREPNEKAYRYRVPQKDPVIL